jgi:hypothetical protein
MAPVGLRYHLLSLGILAVGLSLTTILFISIHNQQQLNIKDGFLRAAQNETAAISQGVAQSIQLVRSVQSYSEVTANANPAINAAEKSDTPSTRCYSSWNLQKVYCWKM